MSSATQMQAITRTETDEEYHSNNRFVSVSMLTKFLKSRRDYHWLYVEGHAQEETRSAVMSLGSAVHSMFLKGKEVDCFPAECFHDSGRAKNGAKDAWQAEHPEKIWLTEQDLEAAKGCVDALNSHKVVRELRERASYVEDSFYWQRPGGMRSKCKPDFLCHDNASADTLDLKVSERVSPDDFRKQIALLKYWLQPPHYCEGVETVLGLPTTFRFIVVSPKPPHLIGIYPFDGTTFDNAQLHYSATKDRLRECYQTNEWRETWELEEQPVEMRDWDYE